MKIFNMAGRNFQNKVDCTIYEADNLYCRHVKQISSELINLKFEVKVIFMEKWKPP